MLLSMIVTQNLMCCLDFIAMIDVLVASNIVNYQFLVE